MFYETLTLLFIPVIPIQIFLALTSQNHMILKKIRKWNIPNLCRTSFDMFEAQPGHTLFDWQLARRILYPCRHFDKWHINHRETSKRLLANLHRWASTNRWPLSSDLNSVLKSISLEAQNHPQQPLSVKDHPQKSQKPQGYVEFNLKYPLSTLPVTATCNPRSPYSPPPKEALQMVHLAEQ